MVKVGYIYFILWVKSIQVIPVRWS